MPTNIFVCYKKVLITEREGGIIERKDSKATMLHALLTQDEQFSPWIDDAALGAGMAWETEIYSRILLSDVLLVLIERGTSQSQWVQREIALANALGISLFPLASDMDPDEMVAELKALSLDHLQGRLTHNLKWNAKDALMTELRPDLLACAERTKKEQEQTLRGLLSRRVIQQPKAPDNKSAASFYLKSGSKQIAVHVASGDMFRIRNVDVFVNSENDYMQMARVFESKTISASLRRMGSRIRDGRYEDTIQQELDLQLVNRSRPVQYGEVFATSAGGPGSVLAKDNRARYIFHVAAVQAVPAEARLAPFKQSFQIEACARSVLAKVAEVNLANGIISQPGTAQRLEQETRAAAGDSSIRSIVFPLFGTGQGGSTVTEVLGPMFDGMLAALTDDEASHTTVTDIYISAFTVPDVAEVISLMKARTIFSQ